MKIYQEKISENKQDSFWYDGLIAENNGFKVYAVGEIKLLFNDGVFYSNYHAVEYAEQQNLDDETIVDLYFDMNNWFEIFYPDGESYVPDNQFYDEVIKEFIKLSRSINGKNNYSN